MTNAFQNKDIAQEGWEKLANQVLTREIQKAAEQILRSKDASEDSTVTRLDTPAGFSDESSVEDLRGSKV